MLAIPQTPGPGAYNVTKPSTYKEQSPQYSMVSRNVMPGDSTQKPGPGAHTICVSIIAELTNPLL